MMETFDFHSMQINWRGKQYPFREIVSDPNTGLFFQSPRYVLSYL